MNYESHRMYIMWEWIREMKEDVHQYVWFHFPLNFTKFVDILSCKTYMCMSLWWIRACLNIELKIVYPRIQCFSHAYGHYTRKDILEDV